MENKTKINNLSQRKKSRLIFYIVMLAFPVLQFCVFWLYKNFNSILLAFQDYELTLDGYKVSFAGFDNFKVAWKTFTSQGNMIRNSLMLFGLQLVFQLGFSLLFSFYIYKGYVGGEFFRVILFLPQIISMTVFALLFKYIVTDAYIVAMDKLFSKELLGLFDNNTTRLGTVLFFNIWVSYGTTVLMFSGAMSGIDISLVEAAKIDGANIIQEFVHITIPAIYSTIISFFVIILAQIFTSDMNLYTLFGKNAMEIGTLGYFIYTSTLESDIIPIVDTYLSYSEIAALGLIITCILAPTTLLAKKLLEKVGPSVD